MTTIRHRGNCPGTASTERRTGTYGDTLEVCRSCRGWRVATEDDPAQAPAPRRPPSRYRCREHDTPVSWRGTGCPYCAADRQDRAATRQATTTPREDHLI